MRISVVVPTFNRREMVTRTVRSLANQSFAPDQYEIIVVVDGSTDDSSAALRSLNPPCRLRVLEQENRGLAAARNTGWRAATADLLLFLDDDMDCDHRLLAAHVERRRDNSIGVGAIYLSGDSPRTLAAECFEREVGAYTRQRKDGDRLALSEIIFGNSSLAKELLLRTGGFDERLRMREDTDLAWRLSELGADATYIADAVARQVYFKTEDDLLRDAEAFAEADALLLRDHPELRDILFAGKVRSESGLRASVRRLVARHPMVADAALQPGCALGRSFPLFRPMGVRALQIRRGIRYYRRLLQERPS
jgi:glycosyltransferase involved in cell wall biosynthesis